MRSVNDWVGVFMGAALLLVFILSMVSINSQLKIEKDCEDKGGILVQTTDEDVCIKREVILK